MGRKGVPNSVYWRMPHVEERAPSLWWYQHQPGDDSTPTPESQCVIDTYLHQCARGRSLPKNFGEKLRQWLQDLSSKQQISPRKKRYWAIPDYARLHRLHDKTFCKRFRELEKIAKQLFPHRVPPSRVIVVLSDERMQAMRTRVLEGADISAVAKEFGIAPFRVGQLCREEKARVLEKREKEREEWEAARAAESSPTMGGDPSIDEPF